MRNDSISRTQLMALFWAGTLAPAAELLPEVVLPAAQKGSWFSVGLACILIWVVGNLLGGWTDGIGAAGLLREGLGPVLGRGLLLIYIMWGEVLLALRLGLCARRLLSAGYRDGSLWFFLVVLAVLLGWIGMGRLSAFARAGQLFLVVLLVAGATVLLLSAGQIKPERLLPLWWDDIPYIIKGTAPVVGVLGWSVFIPFLMGAVSDQGERKRWHWSFWSLGGGLLLTIAQAVIQGNLGTALAQRLDAPFFILAKSVGIKGAFQRVESVIAAIWCFSDVVMAGVLIFALRELIKAVWSGGKDRVWIGGAVVGGAIGLAFLLIPQVERWNKEIAPAVHLALCAISLVFWGFAKMKCGKKCGKKHILWSKRSKNQQI